MENCFLIVGLGNPGVKYARTRHNAGFMVADRLARRWQADWKVDERFDARWARAERAERQVMLCQPQTYMNRSGEAVAALMNYYRLPPQHLIVLVDDADLPLGTLRLRGRGSSGGHHGLESIERHLGSRDYARLRVGIGRLPGGEREIHDYVLGRFEPGEGALLEQVLERAADQVECWLSAGLQRAMNEFNGTINIAGTKES